MELISVIIIIIYLVLWLSLFANVSKLAELQAKNNEILTKIYNLNYYHYSKFEQPIDKAKD